MTSQTTTFDTGTVGSSIVAGFDGIDSIVDTPAPKFIAGYHGAAQVRAGDGTSTANSRFRVNLGVSGDHYGSIYMKYNTPHSTAGAFIVFFNWASTSNSIMASLRVGGSRELNIRVGSSTVVRTGSAGDIPNNAEFRFDWQVTGTTINWRLFYDPEATAASTPDLSGSFSFTAATISRLILGCNSSTTLVQDFSYDTVRARDSGSWWDPYNPATAGAAVTVWNGTSEVAATAKVWNGSAEVDIGSWAVE